MNTPPQLAARITQFENMAQADPANEMAHFSLGRAYAEAGRFADAADSFLRCTQLSPDMSKAWQLAGEMLVKAGNTARAADVLTQGFEVAARKGDFMPRTAIAGLLKQIGAPVPEVAGAAGAAAPLTEGQIICRQSGRPGAKMARPPFRGALGAWIQENISAETWRQWIGQGTKVINELRLDLSRDQDSATYDQHMREYLGIDDALLAQIHAGTAPRAGA
ncbi:MAG: Fe(2+)-trafficking protein [Phycisphaeraceae bacterium]|nr:Fe(2+)-trafficking protein [Phycisphaeraceae bacterium]